MTFFSRHKIALCVGAVLCLLCVIFAAFGVWMQRPQLILEKNADETPMLNAVTLSGIFGDEYTTVSFTLENGVLSQRFYPHTDAKHDFSSAFAFGTFRNVPGDRFYSPLLEPVPEDGSAVRFEVIGSGSSAAVLRITQPEKIRLLAGARYFSFGDAYENEEVLTDTGLSLTQEDCTELFGFPLCFVQASPADLTGISADALPEYITAESEWTSRRMLWNADSFDAAHAAAGYFAGEGLTLSDPALCAVSASLDGKNVLFFPPVSRLSGTMPVFRVEETDPWNRHAFAEGQPFGKASPVTSFTPKHGFSPIAAAALSDDLFALFAAGESAVSVHLFSISSGKELDSHVWQGISLPQLTDVSAARFADGAVLCINDSIFMGFSVRENRIVPTAVQTAEREKGVSHARFAAAADGVLYRFEPYSQKGADGLLHTVYLFTAYGTDGSSEQLVIRTPAAEDQLMLDSGTNENWTLRDVLAVTLERRAGK